MKPYTCDLVQDLLPLYEDGCCSEESRAIVQAHLAECPDCREILEEMHLPFLGMPSVSENTPAQTFKKGMRRLRKICISSVTGAAAILLAALVLAIITWVAGGIINRTFEVNHTTKCYYLEYDQKNGFSFSGESTFSIAGVGESKRFSKTLGDFTGSMEVADYPVPMKMAVREFSCMVYDDLVLVTNHGIEFTKPDAQYYYMVYISPTDPDVCMIFIHLIESNKTIQAVCGKDEADAMENYRKYTEAFGKMVRG